MQTARQVSFFSPSFADPDCIAPGTFERFLHDAPDGLLAPPWLFSRWHGHGHRGRNAWPAKVLLCALLLGSAEGVSRRGIARRLRRNTSWRAACGLEIGGPSPDEATFRRFERYLRAREPKSGIARETLLHEHIVNLCSNRVLGKSPVWVIDGTPMWCFGACVGTVRLLGEGLRRLCRRYAEAMKRRVDEVASELELPVVLAKSVKGAFRIDWSDSDARANVLDSVTRQALRMVRVVRRSLDDVRPKRRHELLELSRALVKIVADDLEVDAEGRLIVAQRVAKNRTVAFHDRQARFGRKTRSNTFKGFRLSVLGDATSGMIAALAVTPASRGEQAVAHRLIRRARELVSDLRHVLGDSAYGGVALHKAVRRCEGVDLIARPPKVTRKSPYFGIKEIDVDTKQGVATCPAGRTTRLRRRAQRTYASWRQSECQDCLLKSACLPPRRKQKLLSLHHDWDELQTIRERWTAPEIQERFRRRAEGERLVREMIRRGCRRARAWGVASARTQAYLAAMRNNVGLLAKVIEAQETATAA